MIIPIKRTPPLLSGNGYLTWGPNGNDPNNLSQADKRNTLNKMFIYMIRTEPVDGMNAFY
jgi:hypothetical protein